MTWVLVIGAGWLLLAVLVSVLIGRSVRLADEAASADTSVTEPNFVAAPATPMHGMPTASQVLHDPPTIPGLPVARPPAPGADRSAEQVDPVRRTGLA